MKCGRIKLTRSILVNSVLVVSVTAASAAIAQDTSKYRLAKGMMKCADAEESTSGADLGNCLYTLAATISKKMPGDVLCAGETCIVRLSVVKDQVLYQTKGFSIKIKGTDSGHAYTIKLPNGKVAHYGVCGTCHAVQPDDENQIPIEMLFYDGGILMELPKSEVPT